MQGSGRRIRLTASSATILPLVDFCRACCVPAISNGDGAPLLRLATEGQLGLIGHYGDPTFYSQAAFYAMGCVDAAKRVIGVIGCGRGRY